ncbi:hypothetical protein C8137_RS00740 [Enterococcus faecalis]|nr:hypothetical protein [Enterococcus faecalis]
MTLTFKAVESGNFDLIYTIPLEVGQRYEELTSFNRGRDFNSEVKTYMTGFVKRFKHCLTSENEQALNERLVKYNKLVVDLRTDILQSVKIPSIMICGGSNYPARQKRKEVERVHVKERELYSDEGKHAKFIENTRKMFDPVLIERQQKIDEKRQEKAEKEGWQSFYKEIKHDEISGIGMDLDDNRIFVTTNGKPSDEVKPLLKKAAMRWSPRNERWQRILTENAIYSINRNLLEVLNIKEKF